MSKVVEQALKKVQETEFIFNDYGFQAKDAFIFWTNFRGEANKFGNMTRNFNLAITPEMGKVLLKNGWRVREYQLKDADDSVIDTLYFVNIKLNMNTKYPPAVVLYSEFKGKRSPTPLDINTIGELDRIDLQRWDVEINAYESEMFPGKITGYLKKLYAIQEPNTEFGGIYDDWVDEAKYSAGYEDRACLADGTCSLEDEL